MDMGMFRKGKQMKVLFVTTEQFPFAKVGGLGDVMFSLPRALAREGCDARVMMPRYGSIDRELLAGAKLVEERLAVPTVSDRSEDDLICNVLRVDATDDDRSPVTTYFLENQEYYELRSNVYGYIDDRLRFALLSRGCLEFLRLTDEWTPDVIVATDWMTGYLTNYLKTDYRDTPRLKNMLSVFSIHNIFSQGPSRRSRFIPQTELDDGHSPLPYFFDKRMEDINAMRRGIMYADVITTVSPTYAKEIMTPEYGEGLDELLKERRHDVVGILNGIDYDVKDPAADPAIAKTYSARTLADRAENKTALQQRFGLPEDPDVFVAGIVSRLDKQKGLDLLEPIIGSFLKSTGAQLVLVGSGAPELMDFFHGLQRKFPAQVGVHLQYDDVIPHLVWSGADVQLVPSRFEPCGLTQMEAMRYGAIPVVRRVGGLADTVADYHPGTGVGTGFVFDELDPTALLMALVRAHVNWRHKESWAELQQRAMKADFSWTHTARQYMKLFAAALDGRKSKTGARKNIPPRTDTE